MKRQSNKLQKISLDGRNLNHVLEVTPFLKLWLHLEGNNVHIFDLNVNIQNIGFQPK